MRGRFRPNKNKKTIIYAFLFFVLFAFIIFSVTTVLILKKISGIIGENGLLLKDFNKSSGNEFVETMADTVETGNKAQIWFEPEKAEVAKIASNDGFMLSALEYRCDKADCNKWVILVHGYSTGKETMQEYAQKYYEKNYNILIPDLRAHGDSQGSFMGLGWLDRLDILNWIDSIIAENSDAEIVLHGLSMGASAVMMAAGEEIPENVVAIIEDSGYTAVWDILEHLLKKYFNCPSFPVMYGANLWSQGKWGYGWKEASAADMVEVSKTPILFVHGSEDDIVPVEMVFELYQAAGCDKRLLLIEGAKHALSAPQNPERYWNEVFKFIEDMKR